MENGYEELITERSFMTSDYYTSAVDEILCEDDSQIFLELSTSYYIAKES